MVNQLVLTSMYGQGKHFFEMNLTKMTAKNTMTLFDHTTLKFMSESV